MQKRFTRIHKIERITMIIRFSNHGNPFNPSNPGNFFYSLTSAGIARCGGISPQPESIVPLPHTH